jgi:aminoglycoside phosphotransferase (APT) family kinase protein
MREALEVWLRERLGHEVAVSELRRITTGHSRGNWFLELDDGSRFVVRVEQGGVFGTSSAEEFEFMQAVGRLGFPVARVRWLDAAGDVTGQPLFVMDFIEGGVATEREDRTLSPDLAVDFLRRLDRAPALERVALVHGDPGPGNFVHDGHRVLAFTDWEFSHLGDPTEDWAFLVSMRGARTMAFDDWMQLIRQETGVELDADVLRYWRAFNFFKGACANRSCLRAFAGANPAPNMALIGTVLQQSFMRQLADLVAS